MATRLNTTNNIFSIFDILIPNSIESICNHNINNETVEIIIIALISFSYSIAKKRLILLLR